MNTITHPVAPEEVMAWLDGELSSAEARTVAAHLDGCAECAGLAAQFRGMSESLSGWTVPPVPSQLEGSITELAQQKCSGATLPRQKLFIRPSFWTWRQWALGAGCALATVLILVAIVPTVVSVKKPAQSVGPTVAQMTQMRQETPDTGTYAYSRAQGLQGAALKGKNPAASFGVAGMEGFGVEKLSAPPPTPAQSRAKVFNYQDTGQTDRAVSQAAPAPMIARTVSLTITVKDFATARAALDAILARHHGYSAQLTVSTPENSPRAFQASLRIPAPELAPALTELRALGRVQNESQSGEEVTQQHTDLVARLKNYRESEERLQSILRQRTGKVEEVLQVEEEIERVRGEIESMEADQKALEHRVDFASVDLQLNEEFKAQFSAPDTSASTRMHNAFIAGMSNVSDTLLGTVLFFEEYGPVLLIWLAIFGLPALIVLRRYRKVRRRL
jgi:anti-sigma factor RsiW